ncbi:trypsin alpha-like [Choristoneura fumiferana]|uniref:trypsin alpha-like n=1 Tax=Choristoneura fumiferana TaxID=7141 RepID=UPI003D15C5EC
MYKIVSFLALAIACSAVPLDVDEQSNRISGGGYAANLQFPFMASLQRIVNNQAVATRGHRCGGALITFQHVLTAASCLYEWNADGTRSPISTANYRVFAGAHQLTNDTSADRVRPFSNIPNTRVLGNSILLNDIGVITLTVPFPNTVVTPIALPAASYNPRDDLSCTVAGWGALNNNPTSLASVDLKFAAKYIYNQEMCTNVYNTQHGMPNIRNTMVCAASYDIVSSGCVSDEGNPLICDGVLTGILALHGNCAASSYPEIYTRVNNYTSFIRGVTGSANTFTPGASILILLTLTQMAFASLLS